MNAASATPPTPNRINHQRAIHPNAQINCSCRNTKFSRGMSYPSKRPYINCASNSAKIIAIMESEPTTTPAIRSSEIELVISMPHMLL